MQRQKALEQAAADEALAKSMQEKEDAAVQKRIEDLKW